MTRWITTLGATLLAEVGRLGRTGMFLGQTVLDSLTPPLKGERILRQTWFIGWKSMFVIALTGTFTGMVVALQGFPTLQRVGSEALLGPMVSLSLIRELGPVLTALMVTGRAGSAIAAEIGIMRNSEQLDALELMGLNPLRYVVVPNVLASVLALPVLTVVFDVIGLSYYPKWHGSLDDLKNNVTLLAKSYQQDIIIAEYSQLKKEVNNIAFNIPGDKGKGTCIWEPLSTWESIFDNEGKSKELINVYDEIRKEYLGR